MVENAATEQGHRLARPDWRGIRVGWGVTAAHGAYGAAIDGMVELRAAGAAVVPILSTAVCTLPGGGMRPEAWVQRFRDAAGAQPVLTIEAAEPLGPEHALDLMIVAPCTGTTLAKCATSIYDTAVLTAVKAMLRNGSPVVIGIATNDALGLNAHNLARLLVTRHVYFVPMRQDHPEEKPTSLSAAWDRCLPALAAARAGRQLQPLFLGPPAGS